MSDQHDQDVRPPVPAWAVERLMEQATEIADLCADARRLWDEEDTGLQHRLEATERRVTELAESLSLARQRCVDETRRLRAALAAAENDRAEAERRAEEILATYNEARAGYTAELSSQLEELATATSELAEERAARQELQRRIESAVRQIKPLHTATTVQIAVGILEGTRSSTHPHAPLSLEAEAQP